MLGDHNTWGVFWKILYYFKNGLCTSGRCPMAITVSWEAAAEVFGLLRKGLPAAVKGETIRFFAACGLAGTDGRCTWEAAATRSLERSIERKISLDSPLASSGFRTKSTAPASKASKTLRFRKIPGLPV